MTTEGEECLRKVRRNLPGELVCLTVLDIHESDEVFASLAGFGRSFLIFPLYRHGEARYSREPGVKPIHRFRPPAG